MKHIRKPHPSRLYDVCEADDGRRSLLEHHVPKVHHRVPLRSLRGDEGVSVVHEITDERGVDVGGGRVAGGLGQGHQGVVDWKGNGSSCDNTKQMQKKK